jgi:hypothetical protein
MQVGYNPDGRAISHIREIHGWGIRNLGIGNCYPTYHQTKDNPNASM